MINHKDKYKVSTEKILAFLNYKREINANMIKYNGPMLDRNTLERMKMVFYVYNDLCKIFNNPGLFRAAIKEMEHYKLYKDDEEKREQKNNGEENGRQCAAEYASRYRAWTTPKRD